MEVRLQVADSSGSLQPHPHGWLYITKMPSVPRNPGPNELRTLTLEVGCALALKSYSEPDSDQSGMQIGQSTDRTTIVNNILSYLGCPLLSDPIPGYPLSSPPNKQGGSFINLIGQIAWDARHCIWQDAQGQIRATSLDVFRSVTPPTPFLTRILGQHDRDFQPIEGAETPPDVVRVVGEVVEVKPVPSTTKTKTQRWGDASAINPSFGGVTPLAETTIVDRVTGNQRIIETTTVKPQALVVSPELLETLGFQAGGELRPTLDERRVETWTYENKPGGKLTRVEIEIVEVTGKALADWAANNSDVVFDPFAQFNSGKIEKRYFYDTKEVPTKHTETAQSPLGAIAPDADYEGANPQQLVVSELEEVTWRKTGAREWERRTRRDRARGLVNPDVVTDDPFSATGPIQSAEDEVEISNGNSTHPPAPTRRPAKYEKTPKHLQAEVSTVGSGRVRVFQSSTLTSTDHARELASLQFALMQGSWFGETLTTDIDDVWLGPDYNPLAVIEVVEGEEINYYFSNGISIALTPQDSQIALNLVWIGRAVVVASGQAPDSGNTILVPAAKASARLAIADVDSIQLNQVPYPLSLPLQFLQTLADVDSIQLV